MRKIVVLAMSSAWSRDEGVETLAHGALLLQLGCELAQGCGYCPAYASRADASLGGNVAARFGVVRSAIALGNAG
jgi:hypothetical protein